MDRRVKALISLLHSDEKPLLLTARNGGGGSPGPGSNISRLGLPEYDWGVNCIHGTSNPHCVKLTRLLGVQTSCVNYRGKTLCPTSFPNPVNFGMTFNDSLSYDMGAVISTELRVPSPPHHLHCHLLTFIVRLFGYLVPLNTVNGVAEVMQDLIAGVQILIFKEILDGEEIKRLLLKILLLMATSENLTPKVTKQTQS